MDQDIPCPITKRSDESVDSFVEKVGFPLIAKPRSACGSKGLKIIHSHEQLDAFLPTISFDEYLLQQFIPQNDRQLNVHLFRDEAGQTVVNLTTEKCRWYPVDGGASCLCKTIEDPVIQEICKKLLDAVDWRSYCEIELIVDPRDGVPKVMEINGRASASIKISELAGINMAECMVELAYGLPVEKPVSIRNDVRLRCILTDVLWFLKSPNRFKSKPSWFSVVRTHDQLFSIADPLPLFCYALQKIPGYKAEMKKRERT